MIGRLFGRNGKHEDIPVDEHGRRAVIDIRDITKTYKMGDIEVHALRGVSFSAGLSHGSRFSLKRPAAHAHQSGRFWGVAKVGRDTPRVAAPFPFLLFADGWGPMGAS